MSKSKTEPTTNTKYSWEIEKGLYLVEHELFGESVKHVESNTNHIAVIDCSGSMTGDLPRLRDQLKRKLPKMMREGDTLSLIWFSGRGEFGALLECEPIATLKDLGDVNKAIDRWLKPAGLTGFKEPLVEVEKLVGRVAKKNKNPFALFFMSDGCDNQWPRADILKIVETTSGKLAASVFVEYGYYADRPLLSAMAEKAGGVHIHADAFDKFEVTFESALQRRAVGEPRVEVAIEGDVIGGFVWSSTRDGDLVTYEASTGNAAVLPTAGAIYYLSPTPVGQIAHTIAEAAQREVDKKLVHNFYPAYAALSLFAVRMKPEVVFPILKALGDVTYIEQFANCFGKQKYSEFMEATKLAAFDIDKRFVKGRDPNRVPADDAFTVLDLLNILAEDEGAKLLLDHADFKYSRVSRGRVDADENLTADEHLAIEVIRTQMAGEKSVKKLKEFQAEIDVILATKTTALKFVADEAPDGYAISSLTWNSSRPNVSVLVRKTGMIDLSGRDSHVKYKIPAAFPSFVFRNYTIVADGLVNVEKLPMTMTKVTYDKLKKAGVEMVVQLRTGRPVEEAVVVINLKPLPVINRKMVKAVTAKELIELEYALTKQKAAQKVYKAIAAERFPDSKITASSYATLYGDDGAAWLKDQGITAHNGFQPPSTQAESKDFIVGKELDVKLKGMSTLPSVKDVRGGKKTGAAAFMHETIEQVDAWLGKSPPKLHKDWLEGKTKATISEVRGLMYEATKIKWGILVGQVWCQEFKSLDANTLTVKIDGKDVVGTIELSEVEIKV